MTQAASIWFASILPRCAEFRLFLKSIIELDGLGDLRTQRRICQRRVAPCLLHDLFAVGARFAVDDRVLLAHPVLQVSKGRLAEVAGIHLCVIPLLE